MKGIVKTILPFLLIGVILLLVLFLPKEQKGEASGPIVVEIWNVDTFEGGRGSRTAFLNSVARSIGEEGVFYYILSYTPEGAEEAFSRGVYPEMLSFGVGLGNAAERALPLPYSSFGGEIGGKCLAAAWCAGKYLRFSLTDDFSGEGSTAVSCGGSNLPAVSASLSGIAGEELPSETAYVRFLNGEYRYLLGTQRDENRFRSRNVTVYSEELKEYNDLFQYICIFSSEKQEACMRFIDALLSAPTQKRLSEIGMYPPSEVAAERTLSVFASKDALSEIGEAARRGERNFLEKYLKSH